MNLRSVAVVMALAALLQLPGAAHAQADLAAIAGPAVTRSWIWGTDACGVRAGVSTDRDVYPPGQPVTLSVILQNGGTSDRYVAPTEMDYRVLVTGPEGAVPPTALGRLLVPPANQISHIMWEPLAKDRPEFIRLDLARVADLSLAGQYAVVVSSDVRSEDGAICGTASSGAAHFTVSDEGPSAADVRPAPEIHAGLPGSADVSSPFDTYSPGERVEVDAVIGWKTGDRPSNLVLTCSAEGSERVTEYGKRLLHDGVPTLPAPGKLWPCAGGWILTSWVNPSRIFDVSVEGRHRFRIGLQFQGQGSKPGSQSGAPVEVDLYIGRADNSFGERPLALDGPPQPLRIVHPPALEGGELSGAVFVADFVDHSVLRLPVRPDGSLERPFQHGVEAGDYPGTLVADSACRYLFVAHNSSNDLLAFRIGKGQALRTPAIGSYMVGNQSAAAVHPRGGTIYVTNRFGNRVFQIRIKRNGALEAMNPPWLTAGAEPVAIAITPSGQWVYVANCESDTISEYVVGHDTRLAPLAPVEIESGKRPIALAVDPGGHTLYVACSDGHSLREYNIGPEGQLVPGPTHDLPGIDMDCCIAVNGPRHAVYVADEGGIDQYHADKAGRLTPLDPPHVYADAFSMALEPGGRFAYCSGLGGYVSQFAVSPGGQLVPLEPPTIRVGKNTPGLWFVPDRSRHPGRRQQSEPGR